MHKVPLLTSASFLCCSPRRPLHPQPIIPACASPCQAAPLPRPFGSRNPISSQGTARPTCFLKFSTNPHSTLPSLLHLPIKLNLHSTWGHQYVRACVCESLPHFIPDTLTNAAHTHDMNGDKCHLHYRAVEVKDGTAWCRPHGRPGHV